MFPTPYIPSQMVLELEPEVVNHEPKIALDGGEDGLKDIRYLIENSPNFFSERWVFNLRNYGRTR